MKGTVGVRIFIFGKDDNVDAKQMLPFHILWTGRDCWCDHECPGWKQFWL